MTATQNPNCDGSHCYATEGEVRVLPYSKDGNLILCRACYQREMAFRQARNEETKKELYKLPEWQALRVYEDT